MVYSANSINYNWHWSRVPQYFWTHGQTDIIAEHNGEVEEIKTTSDGTVITIMPDDDTVPAVYHLKKDATVYADEGETIRKGTSIAIAPFSEPGVLLKGLWLTLVISVAAIVLGIVIGLLAGLCRISSNPALRWWAITYIEIIRGSPLLVQIYLWYFVFGKLIDAQLGNIGLSPLSPLAYGAIALATFTGAYVAEIVRAGIQSVPRGQVEAARSLGLTRHQTMRRIVLPQAFRRILPPLAGQFISLIKDSSLLGVMAVQELTKRTREAITSSMQPFEFYFTCALLYLLLTFTLSIFVQYLERKAVRR
ncbi:hypothetical protein AAG570_014063 [Ranatra chinensis]|uniref:ABC transmembrane type-1 domain-containing protein n=1 Tax=Ranatra chinensis TaxID=642074 RepID=A0ABD0Y5M7_9HEMI